MTAAPPPPAKPTGALPSWAIAPPQPAVDEGGGGAPPAPHGLGQPQEQFGGASSSKARPFGSTGDGSIRVPGPPGGGPLSPPALPVPKTRAPTGQQALEERLKQLPRLPGGLGGDGADVGDPVSPGAAEKRRFPAPPPPAKARGWGGIVGGMIVPPDDGPDEAAAAAPSPPMSKARKASPPGLPGGSPVASNCFGASSPQPTSPLSPGFGLSPGSSRYPGLGSSPGGVPSPTPPPPLPKGLRNRGAIPHIPAPPEASASELRIGAQEDPAAAPPPPPPAVLFAAPPRGGGGGRVAPPPDSLHAPEPSLGGQQRRPPPAPSLSGPPLPAAETPALPPLPKMGWHTWGSGGDAATDSSHQTASAPQPRALQAPAEETRMVLQSRVAAPLEVRRVEVRSAAADTTADADTQAQPIDAEAAIGSKPPALNVTTNSWSCSTADGSSVGEGSVGWISPEPTPESVLSRPSLMERPTSSASSQRDPSCHSNDSGGALRPGLLGLPLRDVRRPSTTHSSSTTTSLESKATRIDNLLDQALQDDTWKNYLEALKQEGDQTVQDAIAASKKAEEDVEPKMPSGLDRALHGFMAAQRERQEALDAQGATMVLQSEPLSLSAATAKALATNKVGSGAPKRGRPRPMALGDDTEDAGSVGVPALPGQQQEEDEAVLVPVPAGGLRAPSKQTTASAMCSPVATHLSLAVSPSPMACAASTAPRMASVKDKLFGLLGSSAPTRPRSMVANAGGVPDVVSLLQEQTTFPDAWYEKHISRLHERGVPCIQVDLDGRLYQRQLHLDPLKFTFEIWGPEGQTSDPGSARSEGDPEQGLRKTGQADGRGASSSPEFMERIELHIREMQDLKRGPGSPELEEFYWKISSKTGSVADAKDMIDRSLVVQTDIRTWSFLLPSRAHRGCTAVCVLYLYHQKERVMQWTVRSVGSASVRSHVSSPPVSPPAGGRGTVTYPDGSSYEGEFAQHWRHGRGTLTLPDGSYYMGEWTRNMRHGKGAEYLSDGTVYLGHFVCDLREGQGDVTWPEGSKYSGDFAKGGAHGFGELSRTDGSIYRGQFVSDALQGSGQMTWRDGSAYNGQFKNSRRHGIGTMSWAVGRWRSYDGSWQNGVQHGSGKLTNWKGEDYFGLFVAGRLERWQEADAETDALLQRAREANRRLASKDAHFSRSPSASSGLSSRSPSKKSWVCGEEDLFEDANEDDQPGDSWQDALENLEANLRQEAVIKSAAAARQSASAGRSGLSVSFGGQQTLPPNRPLEQDRWEAEDV
eukprot:TRINITY_DN80220_c0_g1_i1.p1 TRINITY_DN80220_c0_g1~~TRINITY_DN80220_c0_g1_i1.p1  ORF type:complete len:1264 (-),score=271.42 TRINITY_DN80220_c0_g1_i1:176-3967(-)